VVIGGGMGRAFVYVCTWFLYGLFNLLAWVADKKEAQLPDVYDVNPEADERNGEPIGACYEDPEAQIENDPRFKGDYDVTETTFTPRGTT
jgi:hypothetical protein